MVLLKHPDEERLWLVIAVLFGVSALLLVTSLTQPWYTASFYSGSGEVHGRYWFEEGEYSLCANGSCGDGQKLTYDDSSWESLMDTSKLLVGIGVAGVIGFGLLLGLYYYGHLERTTWIKVSWVIGFVATILGITYFSLNAGSAGANQLQEMAQQRGIAGFPPPEARFWGAQEYASGDLVSSPGVGWLLALLALVNLVAPTILLYQFPERVEDEVAEEDYALEEDDLERDVARASNA